MGKGYIIDIKNDVRLKSKLNNLYKGSNNYPLRTNVKTFPSKEFLETFDLYPQLKFVQYGNWSTVLDSYKNVSLGRERFYFT